MSTIHLSKDGIRYTNDYNPNCDEYVDKVVDSLIPHLRCEIKISDDYTLEDLFKILDEEVSRYDLIFGSELGNHPLSLYIDDINKDAGDIEKDGMEFLEVYWSMGCEEYNGREKEVQVSADFHGWGVWANDEHSPYPDEIEGGFAIEFTPLAQLRHYPLKIRTKTKIYLDNGKYEKDEEGNMTSKILFEGHKFFTVFDFISAILFEISWGGSPNDRDETFKDIEDDVQEVKDKIASGDTLSFKNFDELKKDLEDEGE